VAAGPPRGHGAVIRGPLGSDLEKEGIWDYPTFREVLVRLRSSGLQIAIDDAGSGYSGLESILQMRPEYIKVANSIVHSLHQEAIKREIITAWPHSAGRSSPTSSPRGSSIRTSCGACSSWA